MSLREKIEALPQYSLEYYYAEEGAEMCKVSDGEYLRRNDVLALLNESKPTLWHCKFNNGMQYYTTSSEEADEVSANLDEDESVTAYAKVES